MCLQDIQIARKTAVTPRSVTIGYNGTGTLAPPDRGRYRLSVSSANMFGTQAYVYATGGAAVTTQFPWSVIIGVQLSPTVFMPLGGISHDNPRCILRLEDFGPILTDAIVVIGDKNPDAATLQGGVILGSDFAFLVDPEREL